MNPAAARYMFADAGAAFGLGAEAVVVGNGADVGADVGAGNGADVGAGILAAGGADAPRPAKKKKNAALMEPAAE